MNDRSIQAQLDAAHAEIDRLAGLMADPKLVELALGPGGAIRVGLEPCIGAKVLAASFADMLGDAENWRSVEVGPLPSDQGMIVVTVRRADGRTPEETVGMLDAQMADLKGEAERLRREHDELRDELALVRARCESQSAQMRRLQEDRRWPGR